jgi:hypothetical protein
MISLKLWLNYPIERYYYCIIKSSSIAAFAIENYLDYDGIDNKNYYISIGEKNDKKLTAFWMIKFLILNQQTLKCYILQVISMIAH